jgi:hypothetical protein
MRAILLMLLAAGTAEAVSGQDVKRACTAQLPRGLSIAGPPVYRDCDVDKPAQVRSEGAIDFAPPAGTARSGDWWCEKAEVTMLVDSTGKPELASVRVTATTTPEFAAALIGSLASTRFRPAELEGRKVRQLVRYDRGLVIHKLTRVSGSRLSTADERRQGRC